MKKDKSVSAGEHKPMPNAAELNRSAELLVRARTGRESAYCVVTFHSYTDHRTLYGEGFVASWWVNAIHVLSRDNDWYLLPDIELALDAAKKAARHFERSLDLRVEHGAYAAIRLGRLAGATTAIALSPQFSLDTRVAPFENRWGLDARRLDYQIERRLAGKCSSNRPMSSTILTIATGAMSSSSDLA